MATLSGLGRNTRRPRSGSRSPPSSDRWRTMARPGATRAPAPRCEPSPCRDRSCQTRRSSGDRRGFPPIWRTDAVMLSRPTRWSSTIRTARAPNSAGCGLVLRSSRPCDPVPRGSGLTVIPGRLGAACPRRPGAIMRDDGAALRFAEAQRRDDHTLVVAARRPAMRASSSRLAPPPSWRRADAGCAPPTSVSFPNVRRRRSCPEGVTP